MIYQGANSSSDLFCFAYQHIEGLSEVICGVGSLRWNGNDLTVLAYPYSPLYALLSYRTFLLSVLLETLSNDS